MEHTKYLLDEKDLPESWYNLVPDLPFGLEPPLNPATMEPVGPEAFAPIFPQAIIEQEVTQDSYVPIPEEVREIYSLWRPTPLFRARRLEKLLDTPAHIYYKYEGVSPSGSHKPNTAVPQAYYNREEGVRRLTTETGAGQWGSSVAFACGVMDLDCTVYMVRVSYDQKPYRRIMMETYGAEVHASPTDLTQAGRNILEEHPDSPGSLGIAISEAIEDAAKNDDAKYSLGSVLNHVLMHQTVIGQEALRQMELAGEYPDVVVGCVGGGSNFGGRRLPLHPREPEEWEKHAHRGRRASLVPDAYQGPLHLRLRRHSGHHPDDEDVHAGALIRAERHPRRWPALPRRIPHRLGARA